MSQAEAALCVPTTAECVLLVDLHHAAHDWHVKALHSCAWEQCISANASPWVSKRPQQYRVLSFSVQLCASSSCAQAIGYTVQAISELLTVPGASATVLEACVPYSMPAMADIISTSIKSISSVEAGVKLAQQAYKRAAELTTPDDGSILGVSCTAALRTVRDCWRRAALYYNAPHSNQHCIATLVTQMRWVVGQRAFCARTC